MKKNRPVAFLRKFVKIFLLVFVSLLAVAFAAPFLFKGKILKIVKEEINKNINATADFKDVDISFLRSFPKVSASITNLHIIGKDEFEGDTLLAVKRINTALNIMSVIRGSDYKVHGVTIEEPRIHAIVTREGKANWDIAKEDTSASTSSTSSPFTLQLDEYSIEDATIIYEDASSGMSAKIENLDHEGEGDFRADIFNLVTKTSADAITFVYGGIPYLSNTKTKLDAIIEVNNSTSKYGFKDASLQLSELKVDIDGFFQMLENGYNMDLSFQSPSTNFKDILSLIPAVYKSDFNSIKTSGTAKFNGFVKGMYTENLMPSYTFNLGINNGYFQYPDLPAAVRNINLDVAVKNPDGITDHTTVDIDKGHIELDKEPFDFSLHVRNPVSNMFIDAAAKGRMNLANVSKYVKLEQSSSLKGLLAADLSLKGLVADIEKQNYEAFNAAGTISMKDFYYASKDYPDGIGLSNLLMLFNPKNVTVSDVSGQYIKTNFSANGTINNLLGYVLKDQPLAGSMNIKADQVNLDDWMGLSTDTIATTSTSEPFIVPHNLNFTVNSSVGKVHYDKLDLHQLDGQLLIADETVQIKNVKANALDGTMAINGSYSTKENKKKPAISLTYDVKGLDVQKTFFAFNTLEKIMPIGKFLSGKLSSQLSFTGLLGDDMMPDLNSLTGQGNLLLIEGFLKKFAPVDKLAQTLSVKELETVSLRDVKNYIQFSNGKVMVKPFHIKTGDVDIEIGGMHGLDQSMEYLVNLKLPRSMMGEKGNQFVNGLVSQVNNKGVPVKLADHVNLKVSVGGSITNPVFKTDLKQSATSLAQDLKQQATDFAKHKVDSTKAAITTAVKDTFSSVKKQAADVAKTELKRQLLGDSTSTQTDPKKRLEETGKGLIQGFSPFKKKKKTETSDSTKSQ